MDEDTQRLPVLIQGHASGGGYKPSRGLFGKKNATPLQAESRAGAKMDKTGSTREMGQEGSQGQVQHRGQSGHQGTADGQGTASIQGAQDGEGSPGEIHLSAVRWPEVELPQDEALAGWVPSIRAPQGAAASGEEPRAGTSSPATGKAAAAAETTGPIRSRSDSAAAQEG